MCVCGRDICFCFKNKHLVWFVSLLQIFSKDFSSETISPILIESHMQPPGCCCVPILLTTFPPNFSGRNVVRRLGLQAKGERKVDIFGPGHMAWSHGVDRKSLIDITRLSV